MTEVQSPNPQEHRGIPQAPFVEDVEDFCKSSAPDICIAKLQELYSKYKLMESSLSQKKVSLKPKIEEIEKTLKIVSYLIESAQNEDPIESTFELADGIFVPAKINKQNKSVFLWLGANVMVEYPYEDAQKLLTKNLENAKINLKSIGNDLAYLKDNITTCEVNIARIFNFDVKRRRDAKKE